MKFIFVVWLVLVVFLFFSDTCLFSCWSDSKRNGTFGMLQLSMLMLGRQDESLWCDFTEGRPSAPDINKLFLNFTFPRTLLLAGLLVITKGHSFYPCSVVFSSGFTHFTILFIHSKTNIPVVNLCRLLQRSAWPGIAFMARRLLLLLEGLSCLQEG